MNLVSARRVGSLLLVVLLVLPAGCLSMRKSGRTRPDDKAKVGHFKKMQAASMRPGSGLSGGSGKKGGPQLGKGTFTIFTIGPDPVAWAWVPDTPGFTTEIWALHNSFTYPGKYWPGAFLDIDWEGGTDPSEGMPHDQTLECFVRWITEKWPSVTMAELTIRKHTVSIETPDPANCPTQQYP